MNETCFGLRGSGSVKRLRYSAFDFFPIVSDTECSVGNERERMTLENPSSLPSPGFLAPRSLLRNKSHRYLIRDKSGNVRAACHPPSLSSLAPSLSFMSDWRWREGRLLVDGTRGRFPVTSW